MKRILHFILMPALILALLLPGTAAAAVKPEVDPEDPDRIFVGGWKAGYGDLTVDLTEATGGRVRAEDFLDVTLPEPDYPWSGAPEDAYEITRTGNAVLTLRETFLRLFDEHGVRVTILFENAELSVDLIVWSGAPRVTRSVIAWPDADGGVTERMPWLRESSRPETITALTLDGADAADYARVEMDGSVPVLRVDSGDWPQDGQLHILELTFENLDYTRFCVFPPCALNVTAFPGYVHEVRGEGYTTYVRNAAAARDVLRVSARLMELDEHMRPQADVNFDGKITASDARILLRYSARLQGFPVKLRVGQTLQFGPFNTLPDDFVLSETTEALRVESILVPVIRHAGGGATGQRVFRVTPTSPGTHTFEIAWREFGGKTTRYAARFDITAAA